MCSLCGIIGGRGHWTESTTNPQVFASRDEQHTQRRERQQRTRLVNQVLQYYRLSLSDWGGNAYILRNRTGGSVILANLSELWAAAEQLNKTPCDPLDDKLLAALAPGFD